MIEKEDEEGKDGKWPEGWMVEGQDGIGAK